MNKKESFFEKRSVAATFGILAFLGGIYFVQPYATGKAITGNTINTSSFTIISFIGLLLLICSIILVTYSFVKRD